MEIKPRAIIVDIDGTISSNDDRWAEFVRTGNKEKCHSLEEVMKDPPMEAVIRVVHSLRRFGTTRVILVTARHEFDRPVTMAWLNENMWNVADELIMAADDDERPAQDYKVAVLNKLREKYNVWLALEDNDACCKAYRQAGLTCFQVKECSYV